MGSRERSFPTKQRIMGVFTNSPLPGGQGLPMRGLLVLFSIIPDPGDLQRPGFTKELPLVMMKTAVSLLKEMTKWGKISDLYNAY